jgi:O-antigen/teichoic acid export membrane protein
MLNSLKQIFKKIISSAFFQNVATVASGTAGAMVITMALAPIVTRLYGPEVFGLMGTFMAILAIVSPVAALTYPIAIVLPEHDVDAVGLAKLSAVLGFGTASIALLIVFFLGDDIAILLNAENIAGFLVFIPIAMLFSAFNQVFRQWLIRKKQYKITARVAVIQSFLINSAKVGLGWFYPTAVILIVISTVGNALHVVLLWLSLKNDPNALLARDKTDNQSIKIKKLAKQYRDFPFYRAPQVMVNSFSQSLPVLMLASLFGPAAAGFYTLGNMVMVVPSALIGQAVGDVFYPKVTEAAHNKENLSNLIAKATFVLAVVGFIPFSFVIVLGPWLFSFVFGAEWGIAGEYARWLAVWLFFGFLNKPSVVAIPAIGEQLWLFYYELFSTSTKVIALGVGFYLFENDKVAVALFALSGAIAYIYLILRTISKAKRFENAKTS